MLDIDERRLLRDLILTAKQLHMHPDSNILKYDYLRFLELNDLCAIDFYKMVETNGVVIDTKRLQRLIDNDDRISLFKFIDIININNDVVSSMCSNYTKLLEDINFYPISYYDAIRKYSEKEFIDIILSYYSTFGDKIYNIVKRYFDENRIQMGHPYEGLYGGFFVDLLWLESGYIFSCFQEYDSLSAASLTHELGHAIDAEMFLFPQQKSNNLFADYLCEVPSATYELGFHEYLKTEKIDIDGFRILNNEVVANLNDDAKNISTLFSKGECDMSLDGMALDDDGNKYDLRNDILYGLGYYMAMHLNLIRQTSIKDYLKVLNNIITSRNEIDLETAVNMMGISIDDFITCKYVKSVIEKDFVDVKRRYRHK